MSGTARSSQRIDRQAIRLRPNYVDAHINLGNVLKDQRRFAEGTECYRQAMRVAAESDAGQRIALWNLSCLPLVAGRLRRRLAGV